MTLQTLLSAATDWHQCCRQSVLPQPWRDAAAGVDQMLANVWAPAESGCGFLTNLRCVQWQKVEILNARKCECAIIETISLDSIYQIGLLSSDVAFGAMARCPHRANLPVLHLAVFGLSSGTHQSVFVESNHQQVPGQFKWLHRHCAHEQRSVPPATPSYLWQIPTLLSHPGMFRYLCKFERQVIYVPVLLSVTF